MGSSWNALSPANSTDWWSSQLGSILIKRWMNLNSLSRLKRHTNESVLWGFYGLLLEWIKICPGVSVAKDFSSCWNVQQKCTWSETKTLTLGSIVISENCPYAIFQLCVFKGFSHVPCPRERGTFLNIYEYDGEKKGRVVS